MTKDSFLVLGIGGTTRSNSSTELALRACLAAVRGFGVKTELCSGADLELPLYSPEDPGRSPSAQRLVELVRRCDGLIIASPGYHGSISGLVKNALDYTEDLRSDARIYFDGLPVGCIACAHGWQAASGTLTALRSVVHSLRGWPTPLGVAINTAETRFDGDGACTNAATAEHLKIMAAQVVDFVTTRRSGSSQTMASSVSAARTMAGRA
jgi:FMN reductase